MFPTEIFLKPNESKIMGQIFTINENDIDYIKHIISTYEKFLSCANDEFLSNIFVFVTCFIIKILIKMVSKWLK
jgi:hypothetical protein